MRALHSIKVPLQRVFRGGRSRTVARFDLVNDSGFVDLRRDKRTTPPSRGASQVTMASEATAFTGDDAGDDSDSGERGGSGADSKPQLAITRYSLLDVAHQVASLVELTPATGRTHQLRYAASARACVRARVCMRVCARVRMCACAHRQR